MEIRETARKHGIPDEDILHGIEYALVAYPLAERDDEPQRTMLFGPDRAGNLLEIVVLELDDGRRLVIHPMRMRSSYNDLLPAQP